MLGDVHYDPAANVSRGSAADAAMAYVRAIQPFASLLDVGCGTGEWLRAARESGVGDVLGVDGINSLRDAALPLRIHDLRTPLEVGRRFDAVICVEVAEHLEAQYAQTLVASLCRHADTVVFSAACPGQSGDHHVNCQWPEYWQRMFNHQCFACTDELRPLLWNDRRIEVWYRQNIFIARRDQRAGREPRILSLVHPEFVEQIAGDRSRDQASAMIRDGSLPISAYLAGPPSAIARKVARRLRALAGR